MSVDTPTGAKGKVLIITFKPRELSRVVRAENEKVLIITFGSTRVELRDENERKRSKRERVVLN